MPSVTPLSASNCPLCGQPNQCAMEIERATGTAQAPCWCTQVTFSASLLESLAPEARRMACICQACAQAANAAAPTTPDN